MSDDPTRGPELEASVTSLLERLPPARRARHLAAISVREHGLPPEQLARLGAMAEQLAGFDPEEALATLMRVPHGDAKIQEAIVTTRASIGVKRYLENDHEGAFAAWAAAIDDAGDRAATVLDVRALFHMLRGDLDAALADIDRAVELAPTDASA